MHATNANGANLVSDAGRTILVTEDWLRATWAVMHRGAAAWEAAALADEVSQDDAADAGESLRTVAVVVGMAQDRLTACAMPGWPEDKLWFAGYVGERTTRHADPGEPAYLAGMWAAALGLDGDRMRRAARAIAARYAGRSGAITAGGPWHGEDAAVVAARYTAVVAALTDAGKLPFGPLGEDDEDDDHGDDDATA